MLQSRLGRVSAVTALTLSLVAAVVGPARASAADETLLLTLTNATRAAAGLRPLTMDSALSSVARQWASSMAAAEGISHNPDLKNQIGSSWAKVGENVGYGGSVQGIYDALLNSPSHLRNIVDPEFERIGVGVVVAKNTVWLVQNFLTPMTSAPAAAAPPTPAPPRERPAPAPTTTAPPPTTTTTTTTTVPPPAPATVAADAPSGLPMQLALMVKHIRVGVPR
jgi:hypothetical protein